MLIYLALQMMIFYVWGIKIKIFMILYIFAASYKALIVTKICFSYKPLKKIFFVCSSLIFSEAFAFSPCVSTMLQFAHMDYFAVCLELISDELFACVHCGY